MTMRTTTVFAAALLMSQTIVLPSCCPCRRAAVSTCDSVRVETRVRREVHRDTVFVRLPRESEAVTVRDTASRLATSLAESYARINPDGTLFHTLANRHVQFPAEVERVTEVRDSIVWRERTVTQTIETPCRPNRWQRLRLHGFWVLLAIVVLLARGYVKKF